MAVLVEALCVIIRRSTIEEKYPGGWDKFQADHRDLSFCADDKIARLSFTAPLNMRIQIRELEKLGFAYMNEGRSAEIAVVDQSRGFMAPCDWLEYGHATLGDGRIKVAACRLIGCQTKDIALPHGWNYDRSLSKIYFIRQLEDPEKA